MSLKQQLIDREFNKFTLNSLNQHAVNIVGEVSFGSVPPSELGEVQSIFSQSLLVPVGIETVIQTLLVGPDGFYIYAIELSGENIGTFNLYINTVLSGVKRLTFTKYQELFSFYGQFALKLNSGDVLEVKVKNEGAVPASFESRILGVG